MDHATSLSVVSPSGSISTSLLDRVKARDADAWCRLTQLFAPVIYHWARQAGLQAADAENVVQEVFVSVATGIQGFRHQQPGDSFRGWLFTIARNKIRDRFRGPDGKETPIGGSTWNLNVQSFPEPSDPSTVLSTFESAEKLAVRRALQSIRGDFQDHTWQAFWLTTVEDMPPKEVAEQLGMTVAAVQQAKYRVKQRLREELGEC